MYFVDCLVYFGLLRLLGLLGFAVAWMARIRDLLDYLVVLLVGLLWLHFFGVVLALLLYCCFVGSIAGFGLKCDWLYLVVAYCLLWFDGLFYCI